LKSVNSGGLKYKSDESGIGPSDHTSFYLKNIPVLHVFTGAHADYHKPTDDWDKINYPGMKQVCDFILGIVHKADSVGRFDFVKTKEKESGKSPKFSVTMGIVPDYMYSGEGVRLDGVSDGKPASKAGLKAGDVLMQIGDFKVKDMASYMETLSKFKKGDEVIAKVIRGETIQEFKIVF
jgi:membrane-associated protease RseP (regulator of RpoE activity)